MKQLIKNIPIIGKLAQNIYWRIEEIKSNMFPGSETYWENRYAAGGNSGVGSYDKFAEFKAEILNDFVARHQVQSVIEFGCGDGNQLKHINYPNYFGLDVSQTAITLCKETFSSDNTKKFSLISDYNNEKADLALSLDVIYHLVEDEVFYGYMHNLFNAANTYVIIYSSDTDDNAGYKGTHVKHRNFTKWIQSNINGWKLIEHIPNKYPYKGDYKEGSFADFFIYAQEA